MLSMSSGDPLAHTQIKKSLKRSASLASLPTPPRTHRRRARGRSRGSCDSESDGEKVLLSTDDELEEIGGEDECGGPSKKRRKHGPTTETVEEDAFWLGGSSEAATAAADASKSDALTKVQSQPQEDQQNEPLLYRKRKTMTTATSVGVAPVSPPPSHRKRAVKTPVPHASPMAIDGSRRALATVTSPPSTPKTRSATRREALLRDSPNNPFLASPIGDLGSPVASNKASPKTPTKGAASYDKPFINYVFRGTRRTYQNPYYNHAENRPLSPPPESNLPIDHPDYSPSMLCAPKVLFPAVRGKKGKGKEPSTPATDNAKTRTRARRRSLSPADEDEEVILDMKPKRLNFGALANTKAKITKSTSTTTTVTKTSTKVTRRSPDKAA